MTREFLDEYNKLIADGKDSKRAVEALRKRAGLVTKMPKEFSGYMRTNRERFAKVQNKPYWILDNPKRVKAGKSSD